MSARKTPVSNIVPVEWERPETGSLHLPPGPNPQIGTSDWRAEMDSTHSAKEFEVLNDPQHVCDLPDPASFALGTDVQCREVVVGGRRPNGECGRQYTRSRRFWSRTPYWAAYDWGW